MPVFSPFVGSRYRRGIDLNAVTAPPYDVIDSAERSELAGRSEHNVVHVDVPLTGDYDRSGHLWRDWHDEGVLERDDSESLYVYQMSYQTEAGGARLSTGVIGALELSVPGFGDVLPHEETTPKARSDRLELTRATAANLSPIWGLSMAKGLSDHLRRDGPPDASCRDSLGVDHHLWRVSSAGLMDDIAGLVSSAPVVIADGHHRYDTYLAYREERRAASGEKPGPCDLTMALVVELAESELDVKPIHRLLSGLPVDFDLIGAMAAYFDAETLEAQVDATLLATMDSAGALGLVLPDGRAWLLHPRPGAFPSDLADLDSSRLDAARVDLPEHSIAYQHGTENVAAHLARGDVSAAVLLRPATVDQITATAQRRQRMPPKTTFFSPKPRTGMVFRSLT